MFTLFKKYKEPFLEKTFQLEVLNNHNQNDNMFMEKLKMNSLDIFKEHYNKFKPVLDDIKALRTEDLDCREDIVIFITKDCNTLFRLPFDKELRNAFYRQVDGAYPNLPNFSKFNEVIYALNGLNDPSVHASIYYMDENNLRVLQQTFGDSRVFGGSNISNHPDYDVVTTILMRHFENCTDAQLDSLIYFSELYEKIALISLEPWMISVLGNALFFKVFVPLHYSGAFRIMMINTIQKVKDSRITFSTIFQKYLDKFMSVHSVLKPFLNTSRYFMFFSSAIHLGYSFFKFNFLTLSDSKQIKSNEEPTATELVDKHMNYENRGIDNRYYQTTVLTIEKIAFEVGRLGGTIPRNIMDGVISRYEDIVRSAAREYDKRQDSGNKEQEPKEES